jgi:hypothetical protein
MSVYLLVNQIHAKLIFESRSHSPMGLIALYLCVTLQGCSWAIRTTFVRNLRSVSVTSFEDIGLIGAVPAKHVRNLDKQSVGESEQLTYVLTSSNISSGEMQKASGKDMGTPPCGHDAFQYSADDFGEKRLRRKRNENFISAFFRILEGWQ